MKTLVSFFNRSEGKWISQRTTYKLSSKQIDSLQADMTTLSTKLPSNSKLLSSILWESCSHQILNDLQNQNKSSKNLKFHVKFTNQHSTHSLITLCKLIDPSLISFKTRYGNITLDETYWFATNKLRLSTSVIKKFNTCVAVSFCSEIKV